MAAKTKQVYPEYDDRHIDENHPYDGSGLAPRVCTDLICMVIFVLYLLVMLGISIYAFRTGNPRSLTHAYNYRGELCGVDPGVEDKPLTYWCGAGNMQDTGFPSDLDMKFPTCVHECPKDKYMSMACLGVERVQVSETGHKPFVTDVTTITQSTVRQASYPTMELGGLYCLPRTSSIDMPGDDHLTNSVMGPAGPLGNSWVRLTAALGGLHRCWPVVGWSMVLAVGLGYGYLFLLQRCAKLLVEVTLIALTVAFVITGLFFLIGSMLSGGAREGWESHNFIFREFDQQTATSISRSTGLLCLVAGIGLGVWTHYSQDALRTALDCVEPVSECIFAMPSMLLQPLIEAVWKLCLGCFLLSGLTWLLATARMEPDLIKLKDEQVGGLTRTLNFPLESKLMWACYFSGSIWLMELTNAISQFIVSYSVILWYYTPKPKGYGPHIPLIRGFIVGIVFHLGSLALGAFLILVCRPVSLVMGYVAKWSTPRDRQILEKIGHALDQSTSCYRNYVQFVTKNAYIDVCMSSSSFYVGAQNSFHFIASEGGKVLTLTGSCFIFTLAGTSGIATLTGLFTFLLVTTNGTWISNTSPHYVENPYFVSAVAALLAAYVASCFTVIFDHTADALLYTFAWNKSHSHNTVQKYAPEALTELTEYKPIAKDRRGKAGATSFFANPFQRQTATEESQSLVRNTLFS